MSDRIEFIEPVVVQGSEIGLAVARGLDCGRVVINGELWGMEYIDDPSTARVKAAEKLALAHMEAQKIADKVDRYEPGCFAIDRDGHVWTPVRHGLAFAFLFGSIEVHMFDALLRPTYYKPRPTEELSFDGVTYTRRDGQWSTKERIIGEGHFKCALDLIWEQGQEIERLKAGAK